MRRYSPAVILLLFLLGYSIYYILLARNQSAVTMVDYWYHLDWARALSLTQLQTWVHPFYAVGYFALLRVGLSLGLDVVSYGQFLSWAGSIACLVAVYLILFLATNQNALALAGAILLSLHPFFQFQALQEGTDMLASGLQLLALAVIFLALREQGNRTYAFVALAGALLGAGYMVRYTTLIYLPVVLICLILEFRECKGLILRTCAIFIGAFTVVASPQLLSSTLVTGTPFYNEQARNVWFGLYGGFDWTQNWSKIPPGVTLSGTVQTDPQRFVTHWLSEVHRFISYDSASYANDPLGLERKTTLWEPLALHVFWLGSCFTLLLDNRLRRSQVALLLLALWGPVLVTGMAWLFTRYLLVPLGVQVVIMVLAVSQISGRLIVVNRASAGVSFAILSLIGLVFWTGTTWRVKEERTLNAVQLVEEIQPLLKAIGVSRTEQLISNNRLIQSLDTSNHAQFAVFKQPSDDKLAVPDYLHQIIGERNPDFILFDWTTNAIRTIPVTPYRLDLALAKDELVLLRETDEYSLYCITPCFATEAIPLNAQVSPQVSLEGYRAFTDNQGLHGLYLYWQSNGLEADIGSVPIVL